MVKSTERLSLFGGRDTPATPSSDASSMITPPDNEDEIIEIAAHGDLVVKIEHEVSGLSTARSFRVSTSILKANSKYFQNILLLGRFEEATRIEMAHKALRDQYGNSIQMPSTELPVLSIKDIGRISVKLIEPLLTDFLYILHGKDTQTFPPVANLANLAIVADRFDSLDAVRNYIRRKKMIRALDGKMTPKADAALSEEKARQRLLVGVLLDYAPWVGKYTARLITKGWTGRETDTSTALWCDIPSRIEEEMAYRRSCVLETIQSLLSHFLSMYTSRERQCKLGYESSVACDSYQLGEIVRFFMRVGTLQLQGAVIHSADPPEPYNGDIYTLLDTLRQVPEYQVDKFHTHCGIRTKLVPLLDMLQECLQFVGVCFECWQQDRSQASWMMSNRPLLWKRQDFRLRGHGHGHDSRHGEIKAMFTAAEREWNS
jgi:hypothetical protein